MLFSVIVPTFNRLQSITSAFRSIQEQSFHDYEVIVVDDGSSDGSAEYISAHYPHFTLVRQVNLGPSAARNAGARRAAGEYLVFLDSDDELFPDALADYARVIDAGGYPSLIIGAWVETPVGARRPMVNGALVFTKFRDYFDAAQHGHHFQSGSGVVRRDTFHACGGFDEGLRCAEDQDVALRLGVAANCSVVRQPAQVWYRRHAGSLTANVAELVAGARTVVAREAAREYPGGTARRRARRTAILGLAIPVSIAALAGNRNTGWHLYRMLFVSALLGRRWKYVLGFPLLAVWANARRARG